MARLTNVRAELDRRKRATGRLAAPRLQAALKDAAPRKSGRLAKSITVPWEDQGARLVFRPQTGDLVQAKTTEEGARPHVIRPKTAKALSFYWPKVGRRVVLPYVNHPGNPPMPWFRPTIRNKAAAILAAAWRASR